MTYRGAGHGVVVLKDVNPSFSDRQIPRDVSTDADRDCSDDVLPVVEHHVASVPVRVSDSNLRVPDRRYGTNEYQEETRNHLRADFAGQDWSDH